MFDGDVEFTGTPDNARVTVTIHLGSRRNAEMVLAAFPLELQAVYEAWVEAEDAEAARTAVEMELEACHAYDMSRGLR